MSLLRNTKWVALSQLTKISVQLLGLAIASRLLPPSDYGLMAMVMVVANFAFLFRDLGMSQAVIQRSIISENLKEAVFWFNISVALTIFLVLNIAADIVAASFSEERLVPMLHVISMVFPIMSLGAVHQAMLERESAFDVLTRIEILSVVFGLVVMIVTALSGVGAVSLVYQALATAIVSTLLLWRKTAWRPRMQVEVSQLKLLWSFSANLTGFNFINYFSRNADGYVVGRYLGAALLGQYSIAYKIMLLPLQNLTFVATRAMYPVVSKMQTDMSSLSETYLRVVKLIALISGPLMVSIFVVRESLIRIVLGEQWLGVAGILAWLAPTGFIQSVVSTTGTAFMACGKTNILMRLGILSAFLIVGSFFIGVHWGVLGVAFCYMLANLINSIPALAVTAITLGRRPYAIFRELHSPIFMSSGMLVTMLASKMIFIACGLGPLLVDIMALIVGVCVYGVLLCMCESAIVNELLVLLRKKLSLLGKGSE